MGQAWCKEKTSKAQDSKSPLDRVFVRCAHRIYPGLKEEGSVLGGATQRVTSSEIGYAGSPPREVLTRGRSIDSVDRPFHPSDWVDVNLEVPSTPRPSSVLTNLTVDTNLYPTTTPTSSCSNLKDTTPVPPPRRRKRNKGRPLPPKPDEASAENASNGLKRPEAGEEPLYSSVRSPKNSGDEQEAEKDVRPHKHRSQEDGGRDGKRAKEIYEHKVNGTGRVISSDVVSGRRAAESIQQPGKEPENEKEYERFARSRTSRDSSTPNREDNERSRGEAGKRIKDSLGDAKKSSCNARTKNYSTVSLPNYDELDVARHRPTENDEGEHQREETKKSRRPVRSSTGSLPAESFLSPFSEKTSVRLEDYIPRSDNLSPYQVLEKLDCGANGLVRDGFVKYDPSKSEDWVLGDIGNCELNDQRRLSFEDTSNSMREEDVVDYSSIGRGGGRSSVDQDTPRHPVYLEKPESFGKTPSPAFGGPEYTEVNPNRTHLRYFDPPTLDKCCTTPYLQELLGSKESFFLDETKHRSTLDASRGSGDAQPKTDRSDRSRMMFARSLSNESEPNDDAHEVKELEDRGSCLIRTISEESLPREMLEERELDDLFDEKLAKDVHNKLKKCLDDRNSGTPPPSPEPKIQPQIQDSDHSALLKVLKEEAAEESNLSSMTPSLTELEAALSDMLEKEESPDGFKEDGKPGREQVAKKMDPEGFENFDSSEGAAAKVDDRGNLVEPGHKDKNDASSARRKVSFCMWEETVMDAKRDGEFIDDPSGFDRPRKGDDVPGMGNLPAELPPQKPSRLNRSVDDLVRNVDEVPTPPRRRNRSLGVDNKKEVARNESAVAETIDDRLI